jgi:HTH-type transcriptional regulator, competence development regulator
MRFERSKEWWLARIGSEPSGPVGAGRGPVDDDVSVEADTSVTASFGEFVHLLRRREGLSVDQFAEAVNIEVSEAQAIEEDPYYRVEARTVWYIARKYDFSQAKLNELAGVVVANDVEPFVEQQRYAARSELRNRLSDEEIVFLNVIVSVIEDQADREQA